LSLIPLIGLAGHAAAGVSAAPVAADASVTAIRAGKFIDVEAGRVLANQIILVRGTKIDAVGANVTIPDGAKVIDLSKMTVLPGLVDCHTHLADLADAEPLNVLQRTAAETAYSAIPNARVTLLAGFTTVRDVGVYRAFNDVAMRDAIAHGIIIGPRMYVAGAYVTISEGAGAMTGLAPDIQLPWDLRYGEANSPWEVRQKIRELAHRGADHIKVLSTGAVLTHGSNPKSIEFTPEELRAAVEEAGNFGLRVEAHAHATEGIKNAIRAGVASVEHATLIDNEGIALAKQRGTYLDMDIYDEECIQSTPNTPADFLQHDRDLAEAQRRGRKDDIRHRRRCVPARNQRAAIRIHGQVRHDADAGDSIGNRERRGPHRSLGAVRLHHCRQIGGHYRRERRPARRYPRTRARSLRDEGGQGVQARRLSHYETLEPAVSRRCARS
jgi:imidazolonepropionase-like amidohydrolase